MRPLRDIDLECGGGAKLGSSTTSITCQTINTFRLSCRVHELHVHSLSHLCIFADFKDMVEKLEHKGRSLILSEHDLAFEGRSAQVSCGTGENFDDTTNLLNMQAGGSRPECFDCIALEHFTFLDIINDHHIIIRYVQALLSYFFVER